VIRERILIVEDEEDLVEVISYGLRREGFDVRAAGTGAEALRRAREEGADLVLLDLTLPDLDGIEVCRRLRSDALTARVPVIMATAEPEETDIVLGLGVGADDYITKPFGTRELVARVRAVLRRTASDPGERVPTRVERGALVVDEARHEVLVEGDPVRLTATEFRLLHFLAAHPGRVFTRAQLLRRVVGPHVDRVERNVDVHVQAIRRKLGAQRRLIETVRGVGYRFAGR
jgi:two-component system phosphate regulon response regulator PhoB